jgi:hypothetical protein
MTLNFFVSVMVYPIVGASIDRVGFLPTFRTIAFIGFGAVIIVLITRKNLDKITGTLAPPPAS